MSSDWIEVLIFAGVAAFVAWRLILVLGTRTGHEPSAQPERDAFGAPAPMALPGKAVSGGAPVREALAPLPTHWPEDLKTAIGAVAKADPSFTPDAFLQSARMAYGLVLASFWSGDKDALKPLLADDVLADFNRAIDARPDGKALGNRLINIDSAEITTANLEGTMAEITVSFAARIEDAAGSHVERDVWSFSRHLRSNDPSWLLIATDID
jgi:predicted lipid-binding transport protein (Tim44 family)